MGFRFSDIGHGVLAIGPETAPMHPKREAHLPHKHLHTSGVYIATGQKPALPITGSAYSVASAT